MAKKTTSKTTEGGAQSTMGRSEQQTGTAVQQAPQTRRAAAAKRPGGPTHEQIARRAEEIWKRHGCPQGEEMDNWLEAEAELKQEMGLQ